MKQELDLDAIQARCEKASAGPWEPYDNYIVIPGLGAVQFATDNPMAGDSSNDTHFIAHARSDIPALLAELRRLRAGAPAEPSDVEGEPAPIIPGRNPRPATISVGAPAGESAR